MANLTKKQEWTIVAVICVVIALAIGGTYFFLTMNNNDGENSGINTTQETANTTEEGVELEAIDKDLENIDDLDFSELDAIEEDLNATDLSELE